MEPYKHLLVLFFFTGPPDNNKARQYSCTFSTSPNGDARAGESSLYSLKHCVCHSRLLSHGIVYLSMTIDRCHNAIFLKTSVRHQVPPQDQNILLHFGSSSRICAVTCLHRHSVMGPATIHLQPFLFKPRDEVICFVHYGWL